jgi:hypothetical protein
MIIASVSHIAWREAVLRRRVDAAGSTPGYGARGDPARPDSVRDSPGN